LNGPIADRSGTQFRDRYLLAWVGLVINERTAVSLEG
jgi:hypothetical protein